MLRPLHLLAALALALASHASQAGEFSVSPVRLDFAGVARSQLLAVTNMGDKPARFLVRGANWTMTEAGGVELSDDDSLLVFPASFTVAAKATQNVRVGTAQRAGDTEKTWRVVLEELPDANGAGSSGATIAVLSVISVPVFMPPVAPRKGLDVAWHGATGTAAKLQIANTGNVHQMLAGVSVTSMRGEDIVQQVQQEGWYILPGKNRVFSFAGAGNWCAAGVTRFELKATDRDGQVAGRQTIDAREACR